MSALEQYKATLALRGKAQKRIRKAEDELLKAREEFGAATELVTQAGMKIRTELGMGTYKLGRGLVLIVHAGGVQVQEVKALPTNDYAESA